MTWTKIEAGSGPSASNLDALTDVDIITPQSGDTLIYENGVWKPGTPENIVSSTDTIKLHGENGAYNLIDPSRFDKTGYYRWNDGVKEATALFGSTDFIPVEHGATYTKNFGSNITFWDADKQYVSGIDALSFTITNAAVKFIRSSVPISGAVVATDKSWTMIRGKEPMVGRKVYVPSVEKYLLPADKFKVQTFSPNAEIPLFIETPVSGKDQPIHPSVVAFDTAWNGYKYWLAYTPYPNKADAEENPCIAASNDLIKWVTPAGLVNPLEGIPADGSAGTSSPYNSDTQLVYNPVTNELECWWRSVYRGTNAYESIKRRKTTNGTTWTAIEKIATTEGMNITNWLGLISPTATISDGVYHIWVMDQNFVKKYESADGTNWVDKGFALKAGTTEKIPTWHIDVIYNKDKQIYEMLNFDSAGSSTDKGGWLTHFISADGLNWTQTEFFVAPSTNPARWDSGSLYKSCLLYHNAKYHLIYTGIQWIGSTSVWQLGLSISDNDNIMSMKGINAGYKQLMAQPKRKSSVSKPGDWIYDQTLNKIIYCVEKDGAVGWVDSSGTTV